MTPQEAIPFIEALANGIDPVSGTALSEEKPFNDPRTIRALFLAAKALHTIAPWSSDEDERLQCAFDAGVPLAEIALSHQRSVSAIRARLDQLAELEDRKSASEVRTPVLGDGFHIEGMCNVCDGD